MVGNMYPEHAMRSVRLALLLVAALFVAAEPVVHTHPLLPGSGSTDASGITSPNVCAICAVGAERIVTVAVTVVAPLVIVENVAAVPRAVISAEAPLPRSARSPPAA
jgi:hypothetical protein